ncbi:MAG: dephospho-CoA kinase [Bacteroidales bacterium]|nr:dephospho-CoA kinase [Bacteroidales bacterium]
MKRCALTGNIGSGKSFIAQIISEMGYPVYCADNAAKQLLATKNILAKLSKRFGESVIQKDGTPDKKLIASIIFNDNEALAYLNSIIHPLVLKDFLLWEKQQEGTIVFMEAALIFEAGFEKYFDIVAVIDCPEELAIKRTIKRDNTTEKEVRLRMKHQLNRATLLSKAGFIINNNEKSLLLPQILNLINKLTLNEFAKN